ncbi:hypothetical protein DFH09DRAFT_1188357 [Mycena vulgaris]|nr:hypothetical protein DFH09DRAFT_1188357 [Mycena vulgaris]
MLLQIAPKGCNFPDNVRFVITSRPEHWADISKSETLELAVFKQHSLSTDSSVQEVHNFINAKMKDITPKDWVDWPSEGQLSELSKKADGLFHYAATAVQWIKEQVQKPGIGKSYGNKLFQKFTEMGDGKLEELYRLILTSFENIDVPEPDTAWRGDRLHDFQHVIGTILVVDEPLTICQITALLADIPKDNFDVADFLEQFRSVLIPGTTTSFEEATPQMHKSFRDYITGAHAPDEFRISIGHAHFVTARSCLEVIVKGGSPSDIHLKYAVEHWHQHLRKAVEEGMRFEDEKMWNLLGQMAGDAAVNIWKKSSWSVFHEVAAGGWKLLEVRTKHGKGSQVDNVVPASKRRRRRRRMHAFPLSPVLASLTVPCLLISRNLIPESGTSDFLKRGNTSHPPLLKYPT